MMRREVPLRATEAVAAELGVCSFYSKLFENELLCQCRPPPVRSIRARVFWHVLCVIVPFFLSFFILFLFCVCFVFVFMLSLELCTTVDVPLIFSCPADHVPDRQ